MCFIVCLNCFSFFILVLFALFVVFLNMYNFVACVHNHECCKMIPPYPKRDKRK